MQFSKSRNARNIIERQMRIQKFEKQKKTRGVYANEICGKKGRCHNSQQHAHTLGVLVSMFSMNSVSFRVTKLSWIRHFRWQLHYKRMHSSRIRTNRYRCQFWRSLSRGGLCLEGCLCLEGVPV